MDQDEVVERGIRSEALLNSKTFSYVVAQLGDTYTNTILLSAPHEKMKREDAYTHHNVLNDIVSTLSGYVEAKDEVMRAREAERQEETE